MRSSIESLITGDAEPILRKAILLAFANEDSAAFGLILLVHFAEAPIREKLIAMGASQVAHLLRSGATNVFHRR